MNYKLALIIVQSTLTSTLINVINNNHDTFHYDCNLILSSMNFLHTQRCVQLVFGHEWHSVECIKRTMENSENVTFYIRSLEWFFNRNIHVEESSSNILNKNSSKSCENFLFILKDVLSLHGVLNAAKNDATHLTFMPYSKLYFMLVDQGVQFRPSRMLSELSKFFHDNAQFGYVYEMDTVSGTMRLLDFLTQNVATDGNIASNLMHPIVNRENDHNELRLSFFHCPPYVVYVDEENLRFDGIDYHLVREVIKNWKVKHILRDESKTGTSPWITMFDDLQNHTADLAMCSIWVSVFKDQYDVSSYYNHACNTLVVPMPKRLSEITAIYTTFSGDVWLAFALLFFATGILLWGTATMGTVKSTVYKNLGRSFLEIMNIATSHGVDCLRTQQMSIKILLISWIIGCLSIGISYVTIYTSHLSKPGYTQVIHTVEDFIENDMLWGSENTRAYGDIRSSLNSSSNPAHHELNRRIVPFSNHEEAEAGWSSEKFGVYAAISNQKYLVLYEWNDRLKSLSSFRVMRKACIFNYYTVFALQKFSPYKELFSHYALQFQEHGITHYWFMTVYRDKAWLNRFFDDHPKENNEPVALTISSIVGALLVLFVSHVLSIIVFICEITFTKSHKRTSQADEGN